MKQHFELVSIQNNLLFCDLYQQHTHVQTNDVTFQKHDATSKADPNEDDVFQHMFNLFFPSPSLDLGISFTTSIELALDMTRK